MLEMGKNPLCILHVGMHKTGTTTIQSTLFYHLQSQKYHYIHLDSLNLIPELFILFRSKKVETILSRRNVWEHTKTLISHYTKLTYQKLTKYIEQSQGIGIISAEMISDMNEKEFIQLVKFLKKFYHDIHLIAYVRPPQSFMSSMMAQKVKEGLFLFSPNHYYPHYKARFEKYDHVLGKCNVTLIPYIRSELIQQDIVIDFCYHAGIEISELNGKTNANPSLTLEALSFLWFYNYYKNMFDYKEFRYIRNDIPYLLKLFKARGKHPFVLHPLLTTPILNKYQSDIDWMENRLGHTLSEPLPSPNSMTVLTEEDILTYGYKEALLQLNMEKHKKRSQQECMLLVKKIQQLLEVNKIILAENTIEQIESILVDEMLEESLFPPENSS